MSEIWIVIVNDRHADPEATAFTDAGAATEFAEQAVQDNARHPDDIEPEDRGVNACHESVRLGLVLPLQH